MPVIWCPIFDQKGMVYNPATWFHDLEHPFLLRKKILAGTTAWMSASAIDKLETMFYDGICS
jgi:hypothetical protein